MNKICTTIKQSQKLIELGIDINTADMRYMYRHWEIDENTIGSQSDASIGFDSDFYYETSVQSYHYIPAWSLTALLGVIPKRIKHYNVLTIDISENEFAIRYDEIAYRVNNDLPDITKDNPVDACVAMIEKLHELKML